MGYKTAEEIRKIRQECRSHSLERAKSDIMDRILISATKSGEMILVYFNDHSMLILKDWINIYNWLLELGYKVEDHSLDGFYTVRW